MVKNEDTLKDLDTILDVMTGADGFMDLLTLLRRIDNDTTASSVAIREVVARFARLCRAASRVSGEGK